MARVINIISAQVAVQEVLVRLEAVGVGWSATALPALLLLVPWLLLLAPRLSGHLLLGRRWCLPRQGYCPLHCWGAPGLRVCPRLLGDAVPW